MPWRASLSVVVRWCGVWGVLRGWRLQVMVDEGQVTVDRREHLVRTMVGGAVIPSLSGVIIGVTGVEVMANPHHVPLIAIKTVISKGVDDTGIPQLKVVTMWIAVRSTAASTAFVMAIWAIIILP